MLTGARVVSCCAVLRQVDNRGSYHRGHAFESVVHRNLGVLEVDDQVLCYEVSLCLGVCLCHHVGNNGGAHYPPTPPPIPSGASGAAVVFA